MASLALSAFQNFPLSFRKHFEESLKFKRNCLRKRNCHFLLHLGPDVLGHLVVETQVLVGLLEAVVALAIPADEAVEFAGHVRVHEILHAQVQGLEEPAVLLQQVLLVEVLGQVELLGRQDLGAHLKRNTL